MKLTLGFSPCPNDTFIFDALIHHKIDTLGYEFDVRLADVEQLNQMAAEATLDITKLSFFAFGFVSQHYQLLRSGSALGKGCGPLLVTLPQNLNKNVSDLTIAIPGELTTANFLLRLAYPLANKKVVTLFSQIEESVLNGAADAGLIIHENRFTYQQKGLVKIMDLGDHWEQFASTPIPLGAISIRRNLPEQVKKDIQLLVRKSIEFAFKNPDESVAYTLQHAQNMDKAIIQKHIQLYVNEHSIDLGKEGISSIIKLYATAAKLGIIKPLTEPLMVS